MMRMFWREGRKRPKEMSSSVPAELSAHVGFLVG